MLKEYARRVGRLLVGLLISAVGITMLLRANVGVEPWSVLQQGMSRTMDITYGTAAMIVGAVVILAAVLMGESFGIGTLANIFVAPAMIDALLALGWIPEAHSLWTGIAELILGMEILALGTCYYMKSALGSGPRDALMVVLARKTGRSVGFCRVAVEALAVLIGWYLGGSVGVGTLLGAFGVGTLINLNFHLLGFRAEDVHQENLPETVRRWKKQPDLTRGEHHADD